MSFSWEVNMDTLSQRGSVFSFARCGKKILLGLICHDSILGPSQLHFLVAGMLGATAHREGSRGTSSLSEVATPYWLTMDNLTL